MPSCFHNLCFHLAPCGAPGPPLPCAVSNMKNANTRESLERIRTTVLENLAAMPPAPSAQMAPVPPKAEAVSRAAAAARGRGAQGGMLLWHALPAVCALALPHTPCRPAPSCTGHGLCHV